jgi:hypothetical protein
MTSWRHRDRRGLTGLRALSRFVELGAALVRVGSRSGGPAARTVTRRMFGRVGWGTPSSTTTVSEVALVATGSRIATSTER